jgi:hypothetical protein
MSGLVPITDLFQRPDGAPIQYLFFCPGCQSCHSFIVHPWRRQKFNSLTRKYDDVGAGFVWAFNGNMENPTFTPSLRYPIDHNNFNGPNRCHLILTDGWINYCHDCIHNMGGLKVRLPDSASWHRENSA